MTATKILVWLACVMYICACVCSWITLEIIALGSVKQAKPTQVVLLTTAGHIKWLSIYTLSLMQAYAFTIFFMPSSVNARDNNDDQSDDQSASAGKKQKSQQKGKGKQKQESKAATAEPTKKRRKKKPWYNSGEWGRWWAFCRSLGHKDMTLSTLYGSE